MEEYYTKVIIMYRFFHVINMDRIELKINNKIKMSEVLNINQKVANEVIIIFIIKTLKD